MLEIFIQTFVLYFIAIDPLGNTTLFLIVTQRLKVKDKIKTALEATTNPSRFTRINPSLVLSQSVSQSNSLEKLW